MSYHEDREARREQERRYHSDVAYDVWRSGRDLDRISYDRVQEHFNSGDQASEAALHEIRLQRQAEQAREEARALEQEQERQYYEQMQQQPEPTP